MNTANKYRTWIANLSHWNGSAVGSLLNESCAPFPLCQLSEGGGVVG